MNICLAGWYFHKSLIVGLDNSRCPVFMVAHREPTNRIAIPYKVIPNTGLEFGCYDWYLKNEWKAGSILFMHDDAEITEGALSEIAKLNRDQCYLFSSEQEAKANGYAHGRAMFCSEKFLSRLKEDGGFWFDEGNHGNIAPTTADSPNYHNIGIQTFRAYLNSLPQDIFKVSKFAVVPGLRCAYRGRI